VARQDGDPSAGEQAFLIYSQGVGVSVINRTALAQSQEVPDRYWRICLGHSIPGLTGVYGLHKYEAEKREVWERWVRHLDEVKGVFSLLKTTGCP
jgi:hypothetical protein